MATPKGIIQSLKQDNKPSKNLVLNILPNDIRGDIKFG
jgi:hypothetical protein